MTFSALIVLRMPFNMIHYERKGPEVSYLSLQRKISCRMPISRSLWIIFSLLLAPEVTRQPNRVKGRGGVQGTLSSMVSWERRRAISNVCLSIISSRLAASPKSLILFTFTEVEGKKSLLLNEILTYNKYLYNMYDEIWLCNTDQMFGVLKWVILSLLFSNWSNAALNQFRKDIYFFYLSQSHPDRNRSTLWDDPLPPTERFSFSFLS